MIRIRHHKIILSIILFLLLIPFWIIGILIYQDQNISVINPTVTNVSNTAFTLTWESTNAYVGKLSYKEENANWPAVFNDKSITIDERDQVQTKQGTYVQIANPIPRYTHYVTISNLTPNTNYQLRIMGHFLGKQLNLTTLKTLPDITLKVPDPVYGRIENIPSNLLQTQDVVTKYRLINSTGELSNWYASYINTNAGWVGDINYILAPNGEQFNHDSKSEIEVKVSSGNSITTDKFPLVNYKPLPFIYIGQSNVTNKTSVNSEIVTNIYAQTTSPSCMTTNTDQTNRCQSYTNFINSCASGSRNSDNSCRTKNDCLNQFSETDGWVKWKQDNCCNGIDKKGNNSQDCTGQAAQPAVVSTNQENNHPKLTAPTTQTTPGVINVPIPITKPQVNIDVNGINISVENDNGNTELKTINTLSQNFSDQNQPTPPIFQGFYTYYRCSGTGSYSLYLDYQGVVKEMQLLGITDVNQISPEQKNILDLGKAYVNSLQYLDPYKNTDSEKYCENFYKYVLEPFGLIGLGATKTNKDIGTVYYMEILQNGQWKDVGKVISLDEAAHDDFNIGFGDRHIGLKDLTLTKDEWTSRWSFDMPKEALEKIQAETYNPVSQTSTAPPGLVRMIKEDLFNKYDFNFKNVTNSQPSSQINKLIIPALAETNTSTSTDNSSYITLTESGRYNLIQNGVTVTEQDISVDQGKVKIRLFYDLNNNGIKEPNEPYVSNVTSYSLKKDAQIVTYELNTGWNLINIPLTDNRNSNKIDTVSKLLDYWNKQGADIVHIAKFENGRFKMYSKLDLADSYSGDFLLIPGVALFVDNVGNKTQTTFSGLASVDNININLNTGWNLVGIVTPKTSYTSNSLLAKLRTENISANIIADFNNTIYQSVIINSTTSYGNDFNIVPTKGYFIRVEKTTSTLTNL